MLMKAPTTTAQPQPPSGGVWPAGPLVAGGISTRPVHNNQVRGTQSAERHTVNLGERQEKSLV